MCGVNGETYETFCHAESAHIAVDYHEPCKAVPGSGESATVILLYIHLMLVNYNIAEPLNNGHI